MSRPNLTDPWWRLNRSEQTLKSQFRTGHCPIGAYFAMFRSDFDSRCRHCREEDEIGEHILRECPSLASYGQVGTGDPLATVLFGDVNILRSTAELISRALINESQLSFQVVVGILPSRETMVCSFKGLTDCTAESDCAVRSGSGNPCRSWGI